MTEPTKPKKRVNSKAKGSTNERVICKLLADNLPPFKFIRSQSSGAIIGGKNFEAKSHLYSKEAMHFFVSDIVCSNEAEINKKFRFVIEAKSYKEIEKFELLLNGKSNIYKWLEEVRIDCEKVDKEGLVIFKYNQTPYYVAVNNKIKLPDVKTLTLPDGVRICYLTELLTHPEFWEL